MHIRSMVKSALFAALIAICAWLTLPVGGMVFTLQTLGIFLALLVLGGKWGAISIALYLLLGLVGLPVFSGFQGGFGVLFGPTGGYLPGFLLCALVYWLVTALGGNKIFALCAGMAVCYGAARLWFFFIYESAALSLYVLPYVLPDILKLTVAVFLSKRLHPFS